MPLKFDHSLVLRKIDQCFPNPTEAVQVRIALSGVSPHQVPANIVNCAILKISGGDVATVQKHAQSVANSSRDFRDLIMWASQPEYSKYLESIVPMLKRGIPGKMPVEERAAMDRRDREQWAHWLSVGA